ncbi:unnamed protein product [Owenia fusiformis]|uniref:CCHC-type domain-containing protein n=1 Tax=Owenia fusiformis TaxID=6347 RepID=A0A8S4NWT8_OWEFU|nr:unnamed protein product [Owenia fusiformis]
MGTEGQTISNDLLGNTSSLLDLSTNEPTELPHNITNESLETSISSETNLKTVVPAHGDTVTISSLEGPCDSPIRTTPATTGKSLKKRCSDRLLKRTKSLVSGLKSTPGRTIPKRRGRPKKTEDDSLVPLSETTVRSMLTSYKETLNLCRDSIEELKCMVVTIQNNNADLVKRLEAKTADCTDLTKENAYLRSLKTQITSQPTTPEKSLLIGSSIIRDIDEDRLNNTDIKSVSGADIDTIHKAIATMPTTSKFKSITLQVGSIDCSKRDNVQAIQDDYRLLVKGAKQRCDHVIVSSITPRADNTDAQARIDLVNSALMSICLDEDCEFINNDIDFKLRDGTINEGYLLQDKLHLSDAGTNRLGVNLKLDAKFNTVAKPRQKRNRRNRQRQHNPPNANTRNDYANVTSQKDTMPHVTILPAQQSNANCAPSNININNECLNNIQHNDQRQANSGPIQSNTCTNTVRPLMSQYSQPPNQCNVNQSSNSVKPSARQHLSKGAPGACRKCGLSGHLTSTCWHPQTVRCYSCNGLGHKSVNCKSIATSNRYGVLSEDSAYYNN